MATYKIHAFEKYSQANEKYIGNGGAHLNRLNWLINWCANWIWSWMSSPSLIKKGTYKLFGDIDHYTKSNWEIPILFWAEWWCFVLQRDTFFTRYTCITCLPAHSNGDVTKRWAVWFGRHCYSTGVALWFYRIQYREESSGGLLIAPAPVLTLVSWQTNIPTSAVGIYLSSFADFFLKHKYGHQPDTKTMGQCLLCINGISGTAPTQGNVCHCRAKVYGKGMQAQFPRINWWLLYKQQPYRTLTLPIEIAGTHCKGAARPVQRVCRGSTKRLLELLSTTVNVNVAAKPSRHRLILLVSWFLFFTTGTGFYPP